MVEIDRRTREGRAQAAKERQQQMSETSKPEPQAEPAEDLASVMQRPDVASVVAGIVNAAVSEATARIMASLQEQRAAKAQAEGVIPAAAMSGDADFATKLGLSIAQAIATMNAQGTGKKPPLAPDVINARAEARAEMERLLVEARVNDERPIYQLISPVYLEETLVRETYVEQGTKIVKNTRIVWDQVPNEAMKPANECAKRIFIAFLESIGGSTADVRDLEGGIRRSLSVLHAHETAEVPPVGKPRQRGGLEVVGRYAQDQVMEKRVLGSIAEPARQVG